MSLHRMVSKYRSRCKQCSVRISPGDSIYWSKETKALCLSCGANEVKASPSSAISSDAEWRIDWSDLKKFVKDVWKTNRVPAGYENVAHPVRTALISPQSGFQGYTRGQLERWVSEGFVTESLKGIAEFTPPIRSKRRLQFVEEGDEFHLDLAQSGMDEYMSQWTKRETIPGIRVDFQVKFGGGTDEKVVNAFNAWTNRMIYSFESAGIDAEINYVYRGLSGRSMNRPHYTVVRLKQENEAVDFLGISPMLSPAAFRGFAFAALAMQGKEQGFGVGSGISKKEVDQHNDWKVSLSEDGSRILVQTFYAAGHFPEEEMTIMLRDTLKKMQLGG